MNQILVYLFHVLGIYFLWRWYQCWQVRREQTLRERVTHLLWAAARQVR
jgi:hypothetical protein